MGIFFFSNGDFPSRTCCDFFRAALFLEKLLLQTFSELLLWHNGYLIGAAISLKQLLLWRVPSKEQTLFRSTYFFKIFIKAKLPPSSHFLTTESSLWKWLFGTSTFFAEEFFKIKIPTEELLFRSRYFCTISPVGTRYCHDIGFLLGFHRDIDRIRIETEVKSLYDIFFQHHNDVATIT